MLPSSDDDVKRPSSQSDQPTAPLPVSTGQLYPYQPGASRTTEQLADMDTPSTGQLPVDGPATDQHTGYSPTIRSTRRLPVSGPITTTRQPIVIRATGKRRRVTPATPPPRRRRPLTLIAVLVSSILMLVVATIVVAPLANGQHPQDIAQVINNILSTGSVSSLSPSQQVATPTATPARLTNEGYCGGSDIWGTCATAITDSGVMGTGLMRAPISGSTVTQVFAHPEFQQWCGCWKPHSGIDLAAPYGTPITATDSGQVIWTGWDWSGLGWAVKINHGHYIATVYGHLARFVVKTGQNVTKGDVIGYEGSTGASTGPHLHFMVLVNNIWLNPTMYVQVP